MTNRGSHTPAGCSGNKLLPPPPPGAVIDARRGPNYGVGFLRRTARHLVQTQRMKKWTAARVLRSSAAEDVSLYPSLRGDSKAEAATEQRLVGTQAAAAANQTIQRKEMALISIGTHTHTPLSWTHICPQCVYVESLNSHKNLCRQILRWQLFERASSRVCNQATTLSSRSLLLLFSTGKVVY